MRVSKVFGFEAAHQLQGYAGPCADLHGHSFRLTVTVECAVGADGLAFDFVELDRVVQERVIARLDHRYLNDLIEMPSAENVTLWIWNELKAALPVPVFEVQLAETPTTFVTYRGE